MYNAEEITSDLGYRPFDADNHYYEAEDAFIRHVDPKMRSRCMSWADVGGKKRLLVGGKVNRFIPNPTFDPVAKPGALIDYFRGRTALGDLHSAFGELDPISPAYRDPAARVAVMDQQGLDAAFMFPTLGVGMETSLAHDKPALLAAFRAFNRWLLDDWTYDYQGRLLSAPYLTLVDVDWAVEELEFVLDHGARIINMRPGPVQAAAGNRSFGDPAHDAFWARVDEAGVAVSFHSGDAGYGFMLEQWGVDPEFQAFRIPPLYTLLTMSPISDTIASFLADGVFQRFPNLRLATIENGAEWVAPLMGRLTKTFKMKGPLHGEDPRDTFRRHVWVSPFYEDELASLLKLIGVDRIIMGSDFPHVEGLAEPASYAKDLENFDFTPEQCRTVMRDNGIELSVRRPV
jgi:predicted TIM-barrel fold metal-dependent hydrolase